MAARKRKQKETPAISMASDYPLVAVDSLQPHPRNSRQGDLGAIIESIKANGIYRPIVVQMSTNTILAGHHLWMAAKECGIASVPVCWVDCDDERAVRILLADNRTNDLASYDNNGLAELLQEVLNSTGTLDGTGFDGDALDELLADLGAIESEGFPTLPSGEKSPFQQMTFTLHDEQAEQVKAALDAAKSLGPFVDSPNENSNGNALARVCETFLTAHAKG